MKRLGLVLGMALVILGAAACGGGEGNGGGGSGLEIDPDSGPPGTVISWTVSACDAGDEKSANLYTGTVEEYRAGNTEVAYEGPRGGTASSGTLTVPEDLATGSYTFTVGCSSSTSPTAEGEVTISVSSYETSFEVTG
jgi:hypothetical protein